METRARRKPRFLCLHGFRTSGEILKKQVSKWPDNVLDKLDLVFLDGPYPANGKSDVEGIFDPPYYEWFQYNKFRYIFCFLTNYRGFSVFKNFEDCLKYVEEGIIKHGPIDGLLGFSQGAVLSAALPGLQSRSSARCVTILSHICTTSHHNGGGVNKSTKNQVLNHDLAEKAFASEIQLPSVHFLGKTDFLKRYGVELLDSFVDPFVINHPKGHTVPRLDDESTPIMLSFLEKIENEGAVTEEEEAPSEHGIDI